MWSSILVVTTISHYGHLSCNLISVGYITTDPETDKKPTEANNKHTNNNQEDNYNNLHGGRFRQPVTFIPGRMLS